MIKNILVLFFFSNILFSAEYLPNDFEDILDLNNKRYEKSIVLNKMTYDEFIQYRFNNDIEYTESWGTEIMYEFYLLDSHKDIKRVLNKLDSNSTHLTQDNIDEIRLEIENKYSLNLISEEQRGILNKKVHFIETTTIIDDMIGGGDGSADGDGDSGDDGDGDD